MFEVNFREAYRYLVEDIFPSFAVPYVVGSPGIGKSSLAKKVAKYFNLYLIDHRISTSDPVDFSGFGTRNKTGDRAEYLPFDVFPLDSDPIPEGYDGFLLLLDEFNSGLRETIAASYKLILDRKVGQKNLHPRCLIMAAGNLMGDRAITNNIGSASINRFVKLTLKEHFPHFYQDVIIPDNWDSRISAFLNYKNEFLMDFDPSKIDEPFSSPRSWEVFNRMIKGKEVTQDKLKLYSGTISASAASEFVSYIEYFNQIPDYKEVIKNPYGTPIPSSNPVQFAISTSMLEKTDLKTIDPISKYINRMTIDKKIIFYRGLVAKDISWRNNSSVVDAMRELSGYMNAWN